MTTKETLIPIHSITLRSGTYSYVIVPPHPLSLNTKVEIMFKTKEPNGLLFYVDGKDNDFLSLELVDGNVHAIVNDGSGEQVIRLFTSSKVNDNTWHLVSLLRRHHYEFSIVVDNVTSTLRLSSNPIYRFEPTGKLHFGGVSEQDYERLPSIIKSRSNFAGCLASVKVNTQLYNLMTDNIAISDYVTIGCSGLKNTMSHFSNIFIYTSFVKFKQIVGENRPKILFGKCH